MERQGKIFTHNFCQMIIDNKPRWSSSRAFSNLLFYRYNLVSNLFLQTSKALIMVYDLPCMSWVILHLMLFFSSLSVKSAWSLICSVNSWQDTGFREDTGFWPGAGWNYLSAIRVVEVLEHGISDQQKFYSPPYIYRSISSIYTWLPIYI